MGACCSSELLIDQLPLGSNEASEKRSSEEIDHDSICTVPQVVVTGFGKILREETNENNFSWRVVENLSETIDYRGRKIPVIKGKPEEGNETSPEPVTVCYSYVRSPSFKEWLDSADALVYLHLGVNGDGKRNCISLVSEARMENVNFQVDDYNDADTPKRRQRLYPDLPSELEEDPLPDLTNEKEDPLQTSFRVSELCENLIEKFGSGITLKGCCTSPIKLSFEVSDDAGSFLCDYLYYVSLDLAANSKNRKCNRVFPKNVLLVHIPGTLYLPGDSQVTCCEANQLENMKAKALAEVIEFIVKKLLEQIDAAKAHTATVEL